ncbi:Uncharacterised protein [Escherichia coli]|nr:Uncharacterised protein [Escherichia coli]
MRYPTREYQRDSPSDLLLRRPQGIKPKKKIVKIRDSGLTRKVISALGDGGTKLIRDVRKWQVHMTDLCNAVSNPRISA